MPGPTGMPLAEVQVTPSRSAQERRLAGSESIRVLAGRGSPEAALAISVGLIAMNIRLDR